MEFEERQVAEKALRQMFIGSQLDGIKFGLSPATTFVYFMHYVNREPDHLWINIETKWNVYSSDAVLFPGSEQEMGELTEEEQFKLLYSLRREQVVDIKLGNSSPHLYITFKSGRILFINGYHEEYECWQAGDGQGFAGDEWLVVAAPQNGIATLFPQN
ncbi:hypothetical protein [Pseudobacillus wudalianchiensis]|uniref:Uncharacterized protein n=1 Tax=Pseudobacillus wudalianchiensis TaxID=1743143 RepID=A0A1B9B8Z6_9BACI|nr:hypothetical protein [Bacillus wudalianchiensis]OCA92557.1 hypothetical protein A8F95_02330 [Bacillus wudalianchiensis]